MRALLVIALSLVSVSAFGDAKIKKPPPPPLAPEAQLVKDWFDNSYGAPDKATAALAKSVTQNVAIRSGDCLKKAKVKAAVADDKTKKAFVKCVGEWAEDANFSKWEVKALADINPDGAKAFAKKLPKDSKIVMGSHSDGFIIVGLDSSSKITAVYVDLSAAE